MSVRVSKGGKRMTLRYDAYSTEAGYKEALFLTIVGLEEKGRSSLNLIQTVCTTLSVVLQASTEQSGTTRPAFCGQML